jgi:hypothetical protein
MKCYLIKIRCVVLYIYIYIYMFTYLTIILTFNSVLIKLGVGIATGYGLDDRGVGVRVPVESRIFFSPRRPDLLWGPPSLSNGYAGLFLLG